MKIYSPDSVNRLESITRESESALFTSVRRSVLIETLADIAQDITRECTSDVSFTIDTIYRLSVEQVALYLSGPDTYT